MQVEVHGKGRSQAQVAASLTGTLRLWLRDAPFGFGLPRVLEKSLVAHLNPLARQGSDARRLECGAIYLELKDGMGTTPRGMVLAFPQVVWGGKGTLNLRQETLYFTLKPESRKGLTLFNRGVADLVAVAGPLSAPYIVVDPEGTLLTTLSYTAAAYTGGASLLLEGIWEELTQHKDPCGYVLDKGKDKRRKSSGGKGAGRQSTPGRKRSILEQTEGL
jgi:hypothetical protein